ncbi:DUF2931 family protein [Marinobacter sp. F4206]|uniref:DUF2931 family protein n=1 Tax=Marinobacter sp. F4206 TaxID=2861777 RepID=UPI001C5F1EAD|nr:DUF2931 family protein [Marinobacter sp. F4206]MBW4933868.1 DUF2931 family protein [Marinobacter sp. F4206]
MRRYFFCLVVYILFSMAGCTVYKPKSETDWYFQLATPKHYDVWVEHLEFELSGVRHWYHPAGTMSCCWRGPSGPSGIMGSLDPFPNYVGLQWFSLAEQTFYQRLIEVKSEWKARMLEDAPVTTAGGIEYGPRNILTFGLAPGGEIVIWIKSQIGNEVEIARLQANEIEGDPAEYEVLRENYLVEHGEYLKKHGIPLEGW